MEYYTHKTNFPPFLPLISLSVGSDSNRFWTETVKREYLSSPHVTVCELPFTKPKQHLPYNMLNELMQRDVLWLNSSLWAIRLAVPALSRRAYIWETAQRLQSGDRNALHWMLESLLNRFNWEYFNINILVYSIPFFFALVGDTVIALNYSHWRSLEFFWWVANVQRAHDSSNNVPIVVIAKL